MGFFARIFLKYRISISKKESIYKTYPPKHLHYGIRFDVQATQDELLERMSQLEKLKSDYKAMQEQLPGSYEAKRSATPASPPQQSTPPFADVEQVQYLFVVNLRPVF